MRELPPVLSGDALQQIASLRDYLVRAARGSESETLETVTAHASGILKQAGRAGGPAALPTGENQSSDVLQREARLRALIVKSAEESRERDSVLLSSIGDLGYEMRQQYLARSEFGEYQQEILLLIDATARQIVESYGGSGLPALMLMFPAHITAEDIVNDVKALPSVQEITNSNIYTIDGKLVMKNASLCHVGNLNKGFYIYQNKKIMIK